MPLRQKRLPADYRGSGKSGNFARSLVGGMLTGGGGAVVPDTEAVAKVASETPFTDKTFDAGTVNRFKPARPFQNFMSGGAGTERASELNVQSQLEESDALRQRNNLEFEKELEHKFAQLAQEMGLETKKKEGQQRAEQIGRNFRSFQIQNPDFAPGFNVSPALSDIGIGELLSAALGENLGQGFIAGIPTARATGAGQGNIATVEANKASFLPALTRALQTLNVNTANAEAAGSARPDFSKAVQDAQFEKLRSIGIGNDAASRSTVVPNQVTVGREGTHFGPIFRTANRPIMYTNPDGKQIPTGQMSREEEMVRDYYFKPVIPIDPSLVNPNSPSNPANATNPPAANQQPVAPFQQRQQLNNPYFRRRKLLDNNPPWTRGLDLKNVY